jgi:hypothetical protein
MQYVLCSQCKFRVPLNKHICATCGHTMPSLQAIKSAVKADEAASKSQKIGFWQQFFGLGTPQQDTKEPAKEEPALG